jgi:predicted DNA-binding transcriptional regulator YafY
VLELDYFDVEGKASRRHVRPLGLWYWGKVWTLVGWCELRDDFRVFRIDRIQSAGPTGTVFKPERGKLLADFYREFRPKEE